MTRSVLAFLAAAAVVAASGPLRATAAADDLYGRMQHVNSGLNSYQADVTVAVKMNSFPFLSPTLEGKSYFKKPDKAAVQFQTVPALAGQLKKVVGQAEPPSSWPKLYDVTQTGDDGTTASFRLVRKKNGRIDHVDVKADDKTATVTEMVYYYKDNGGSIRSDYSYEQIGGNWLIKSQSGKIDIPHYNADMASTFTNYKLNVAIDDNIFKD